MAPEQISSCINFSPVMENDDDTGWSVLGRLADALGIHRDHFFADVPHAGKTASADECLRLWSEIATEEGRQQALQALQTIVRMEKALQSKNL